MNSYQAFGSWKQSGLSSLNRNWHGGRFVLQRNHERRRWMLLLFLDVKPDTVTREYHVKADLIKNITANKKMVVISFKKGDTIFMKFSEDGSAAQWRDVLVQACDNSLKVNPENEPREDTRTKEMTPQKKKEMTPQKSKEMTPQMSRKDQTSSIFEGTPQKTRRSAFSPTVASTPVGKENSTKKYLQSAINKSETVEHKTNSFYSSGSPSPLFKSYGSAATYSSTKRRPGLMPLHPENKRPRLNSTPSRSVEYSWLSKSPALTPEHSTQLQGFSNLGNTCYMNAILQSLLGLESFATDLNEARFIAQGIPSERQQNRLYVAMAKLLLAKKQQVSSEKCRQCLSDVKRNISSSAKRFLGYQQHDAHEFLSQILDQLKEEIVKVNKQLAQDKEDSRKWSSQISDEEAEIRKPSDHNRIAQIVSNQFDGLPNPTASNFEFEVEHYITCQSCHDQVTKAETFNDLSLDLPHKSSIIDDKGDESDVTPSIQDALDKFFIQEQLEYRCERCEANRAEVSHQFSRLPRLMILHLKRYNFDMSTSLQSKSGRQILIPRYLTLQAHCNEQTRPPSPPKHPRHLLELSQGSHKSRSVFEDRLDSPDIKRPRFKKLIRPAASSTIVSSPENEHYEEEDKTTSPGELNLKHMTEDEQISFALQESMKEAANGQDAVAACQGDPPQSINRHFRRDSKSSLPDLDDEDGMQMDLSFEDNLATGDGLILHYSENPAAECVETMAGNTECQSSSYHSEYMCYNQPLPTCNTQADSTGYSSDSVFELRYTDNTAMELTDVKDGNIPEPGENKKSSQTQTVKAKSDISNGIPANEESSDDDFITISKDKNSAERSVSVKSGGCEKDINLLIHKKNVSHEDTMQELWLSDDEKPGLASHNSCEARGTDVWQAKEKSSRKSYTPIKRLKSQAGAESADSSEWEVELVENKENRSPPHSREVSNRSPHHSRELANRSPTHRREVANVQPVRLTSEPEWVEEHKQNKEEEQDKEEDQLQKAIELSLREQEKAAMQEEEEMMKAIELSQQEFTQMDTSIMKLTADPVSPKLVRSLADRQELEDNADKGDLPYSYRLVSVVSHLGSSTNAGHYINDVYDVEKKKWHSYNDSHVKRIPEQDVLTNRQRSGYIFFYMHKDMFEELEEMIQTSRQTYSGRMSV